MSIIFPYPFPAIRKDLMLCGIFRRKESFPVTIMGEIIQCLIPEGISRLFIMREIDG